MKGAGGSSGGLGTFVLGLLLSLIGLYLLLNQVTVTSGFWGTRYGFGGLSVSPFGVTLFPFLIGVGLVFFNGRSTIGWLLTAGSFLFIIVGIIANLRVYFAPTSLWVTLIILIMLVGGLGLIARSLRPYGGT